MVSYYSILKAGAVVVPVNYMFKIEEAKYILQDSEAAGIITSRAYIDMAEELRLRVDSLKHIISTTITREGIIDFAAISFLCRYCLHEPTPVNRGKNSNHEILKAI